MTAKEARKIIEEGKFSSRHSLATLEFAHGYLEALEGPEVKALVEALEIVVNGYLAEQGADFDWDEWYQKAKEALARCASGKEK